MAVLPSYLNALAGRGVHVVTVNDYLARRDSEWVGQVPRFLGMQVGMLSSLRAMYTIVMPGRHIITAAGDEIWRINAGSCRHEAILSPVAPLSTCDCCCWLLLLCHTRSGWCRLT